MVKLEVVKSDQHASLLHFGTIYCGTKYSMASRKLIVAQFIKDYSRLGLFLSHYIFSISLLNLINCL